MIDSNQAALMARYNRWMNERVYAVCAELDDEARLRDRGAFFGSIELTLNHILYGDLAFMSRFTGEPAEPPPIGERMEADFAALRTARAALDARIEAWASALTAPWLAATLSYVSLVDGRTRTFEHWVLVTHMFNHQTHHRGQVTTLLSQSGIDIGSTDIPFMPGMGGID